MIASLRLLSQVGQGASPDLKLNVAADQAGPRINPAMWGIFFEDINFGADGGVYAELVKNRSFEFIAPLMAGPVDALHSGCVGLDRIRQRPGVQPVGGQAGGDGTCQTFPTEIAGCRQRAIGSAIPGALYRLRPGPEGQISRHPTGERRSQPG